MSTPVPDDMCSGFLNTPRTLPKDAYQSPIQTRSSLDPEGDEQDEDVHDTSSEPLPVLDIATEKYIKSLHLGATKKKVSPSKVPAVITER